VLLVQCRLLLGQPSQLLLLRHRHSCRCCRHPSCCLVRTPNFLLPLWVVMMHLHCLLLILLLLLLVHSLLILLLLLLLLLLQLLYHCGTWVRHSLRLQRGMS
jgi:hypothetical protein